MGAETNRYVNFDNAQALWDAAAKRYVRKDGNKVLSDNNFTSQEKQKLSELENYDLPIASVDTLGGMKVGAGLRIDEEGVVSADVGPIESLTQHDIDVITGSADSEEMFLELLENGGDVILENDMVVSDNVILSKDVVLDLNNHNITSSKAGYMFVAKGAKLTLKGGNIATTGRIAQAENGGQIIIEGGEYQSGDVALSAYGAGSKVVVEDGYISAQEGGVGAFAGANIEVNGGTIEGLDNFPVFTNGTAEQGNNTIVLNGGRLIGNIQSSGYEACGVYIANNDTFTMNGGTIVADGGCGILMRGGNVTINDGTVEVTTGPNVPGWVGDNKTKMSASAVIYHESANYPGKAGMSLTINGGTFTGADHSVEVLSNEQTPNVAVNGGTFTPAYPEV